MRRIALLVGLLCFTLTGCQRGYNATFYRDAGAKGLKADMKVAADGKSGESIDAFDRYGLQNQISVVTYRLPPGTALLLYTAPSFKMFAGDLPTWWGDAAAVRNFIQSDPGLTASTRPAVGKTPLVLKGTGRNETVDLRTAESGAYHDAVRSAELWSQDKPR